MIWVRPGTSATELMFGLRNGFKFADSIDKALLIMDGKVVGITRQAYNDGQIADLLALNGIK